MSVKCLQVQHPSPLVQFRAVWPYICIMVIFKFHQRSFIFHLWMGLRHIKSIDLEGNCRSKLLWNGVFYFEEEPITVQNSLMFTLVLIQLCIIAFVMSVICFISHSDKRSIHRHVTKDSVCFSNRDATLWTWLWRDVTSPFPNGICSVSIKKNETKKQSTFCNRHCSSFKRLKSLYVFQSFFFSSNSLVPNFRA